MPHEQRIAFVEAKKPRAFGTGLVALDVVINVNSEETPGLFAGGSCGNVLTILSYLGWSSSPISRLRSGPAADRVVSDLKSWNVGTKFVTLEEDGSTPIIIQRRSDADRRESRTTRFHGDARLAARTCLVTGLSWPAALSNWPKIFLSLRSSFLTAFRVVLFTWPRVFLIREPSSFSSLRASEIQDSSERPGHWPTSLNIRTNASVTSRT